MSRMEMSLRKVRYGWRWQAEDCVGLASAISFGRSVWEVALFSPGCFDKVVVVEARSEEEAVARAISQILGKGGKQQ